MHRLYRRFFLLDTIFRHLRGSEGGADGAELDVGEDDSGAWGVTLDILGLAGVDAASTTSNTWGFGVLVGGEGGVEPQHVDGIVVPERHDQDVAAGERGTHGVEATELEHVGLVTEGSFLLLAERVGDGVSWNTLDGGLAVGIRLAVLDVETLDLAELGAGANELGDNGKLLGGVDGSTGAVELTVTHAVALEGS